jgi:CBS-domain-containing membrane protein
MIGRNATLPRDGRHDHRPRYRRARRSRRQTAETPIADVMSHEVKYCFETDDIDAVSVNMANIKVRRLPVLNVQKRLVGIVALARYRA